MTWTHVAVRRCRGTMVAEVVGLGCVGGRGWVGFDQSRLFLHKMRWISFFFGEGGK